MRFPTRLVRLLPLLLMPLLLVAISAARAQEPARIEELPQPERGPVVQEVLRPLGLQDFEALALSRNPRLAQAGAAVAAAGGRALQAGLYPNPTLSVTGDELGDRQGAGGIWTAPYVSQEIVIGGKLSLSEAAAGREVTQAELSLAAEQASLLTAVRQRYFEHAALLRRAEMLRELVGLSEKLLETTAALLEAKQVARLDLVQLEVEQERFRTDLESAERELPATFRRLAAVAGEPHLVYHPVSPSFPGPLPEYALEETQERVLARHPTLQATRVGIERAELLLARAERERIPNVTVGTGYVRQNQNRSDDWTIGVSMNLPIWNRNQGNIQAAAAELRRAEEEIRRVENDLVEQVAEAFRSYAAARKRVERYERFILPKTREAYQLSRTGYETGQFDYLRVLEAQRSSVQANLEYVRSLGEAWSAASTLAGLTLDEQLGAELHSAEERR